MSIDERPEVAEGLASLIHDKAWQHLGMTGDEFMRAWYSGQFHDDPRPMVAALDELMRTGRWGLLAPPDEGGST